MILLNYPNSSNEFARQIKNSIFEENNFAYPLNYSWWFAIWAEYFPLAGNVPKSFAWTDTQSNYFPLIFPKRYKSYLDVVDFWLPFFVKHSLNMYSISIFVCKGHVCTLLLQSCDGLSSISCILIYSSWTMRIYVCMQYIPSSLFCVI